MFELIELLIVALTVIVLFSTACKTLENIKSKNRIISADEFAKIYKLESPASKKIEGKK